MLTKRRQVRHSILAILNQCHFLHVQQTSHVWLLPAGTHRSVANHCCLMLELTCNIDADNMYA